MPTERGWVDPETEIEYRIESDSLQLLELDEESNTWSVVRVTSLDTPAIRWWLSVVDEGSKSDG